MSPDAIGSLVEGSLITFAGVYMTLLGLRMVGKRPGENVLYDQWIARYGKVFRFGGPFLITWGVLNAMGVFRGGKG